MGVPQSSRPQARQVAKSRQAVWPTAVEAESRLAIFDDKLSVWNGFDALLQPSWDVESTDTPLASFLRCSTRNSACDTGTHSYWRKILDGSKARRDKMCNDPIVLHYVTLRAESELPRKSEQIKLLSSHGLCWVQESRRVMGARGLLP